MRPTHEIAAAPRLMFGTDPIQLILLIPAGDEIKCPSSTHAHANKDVMRKIIGSYVYNFFEFSFV